MKRLALLALLVTLAGGAAACRSAPTPTPGSKEQLATAVAIIRTATAEAARSVTPFAAAKAVPAATPTTAPTATRTMVPPTPTKLTATVTPTATATGAAMVYYFFSTNCEYCAAQAPDMERFHKENPNVRVVGVPLYASQEGAAAFAKKYGLTFEMSEDAGLVKALGAVSKHPVIAFQRTPGGALERASDGTISTTALKQSYQKFVGGGGITVYKGTG